MQGSDKNKTAPALDAALDAALDVIESEVSGTSETSSAVVAKEEAVLRDPAASSISDATDSETQITVDDDWESLLDDSSASLEEREIPEQKTDTSRLDPDPIPSDDDFFGSMIDAPSTIEEPVENDGVLENIEAPTDFTSDTSTADNAVDLELPVEPMDVPVGLDTFVDLEEPAELPVDFDVPDKVESQKNDVSASDPLDFLDEPIEKSTEAGSLNDVADKVKTENSAAVTSEKVPEDALIETPPETDNLDGFENEEKQPVLNDDLDELFGNVVESKTPNTPTVQKEPSNEKTSDDDIMDAMLEEEDGDDTADPLSDWSESPAGEEDLLPDLFEPEQESSNSKEDADDDVAGIFASLDENSSGNELGDEGENSDLSNFENLLDQIEDQRGGIPILDKPEKEELPVTPITKNDALRHASDESATQSNGIGEMESEKPSSASDVCKDVPSENKKSRSFGAVKIIGLGVFALSIGVISSVFAPKYLTPYLPASFSQKNETPEMLATINRLESAIKELRTKFATKNDSADANASANEKLMKMYQELASSQKALSDEQAHNTNLISTLSSELKTYESEMLTRFGQVLSLTKNAVESSAEQSQTIKEAVLREALATMKDQQNSEGAQTVAALQAKLLESNKRTAELESAVVAQRNIISLVESEVDYVKERMLDNAKKKQVSLPLNDMGSQADIQVFVDPKPTVENQTEVVKNDVPQRIKLHLVGVLRKKEGNYELYVQRSDAKGSTGILSYDYKPGYSVVIPGYGRILKVREDDNPKLRVNYVLEMEDGQIRGKP
jgi:hypothetical protein